MSLSSLSFLSFLVTPSFWSSVGFFISYIATSFIALEVFRLIYSDSTKREAEKFLDAYTKQRTASPRRHEELKKISIEELERPRTPELTRRTSAATTTTAVGAGTPESEKTLVAEEKRRRRAHSTAAQVSAPVHVSAHQNASPPRRLRKRSDTLNSASSAEVKGEPKGLFRRRRSASPASDAGSKASSRHASPLRRSRKEKDTLGLGLGLGLSKTARVKV